MTRQSTSVASTPPSAPWGSRLTVLGISIALTVLFWGPLWEGGTLIGGDTFSYYFPQKTYLAESLRSGEFPLWNPRVGAGYPIVAESQTGALYPPTVLLYWALDVEIAYSANQLLHYCLAFIGLWAVARQYGLSWGSSWLAALVYVYGWFPARICLEWAIIGGAYLPWCVWFVEKWWVTGNRRTLMWLAPVFGLFLLAGHFHLAFITTLGLSAYVLLRCWWRDSADASAAPLKTVETPRWSRLAWFGGVLVAAYLLAAVQLGPTLELMSRSQRQEFDQGNDPGYGHIPPWYLTQIVSLWMWYGPDLNPDLALFDVGPLAYPCNTNKVEAHLYFGMVPLFLVVVAIVAGLRDRQWVFRRDLTCWLGVGVLGLVLSVGWPFVVLKHFPGFGYFRGAGRYSVLTAFAMSLLAGAALDLLFPPWNERGGNRFDRKVVRGLGVLLVLGLTTWDLFAVSRWITYATMTQLPFTPVLQSSELRAFLAEAQRPVRLSAPGANVVTMLGCSAFPVYLGLGPQEYFDPRLASDFHPEKDMQDPVAVARQVEWLRRNGVTHILSIDPLDEAAWTARLAYGGPDRLVGYVWDKIGMSFFLYELIDAPGRVVNTDGAPVAVTEFTESANRLAFTVSVPSETTVVARELAYPGWVVSVDGHLAPAQVIDSMYRGVAVSAGQHRIEWRYRPRSVWLGLSVSGLALLAWVWVYRKL